MKHNYFNAITSIEKIHRLFMDVVGDELYKLQIRNINNIQVLIIYNIGTQTMSVGDLTSRGYYKGTNVSYNLRKLVENGYVLQTPDPNDRRSMDIKLTQKGLEMYESVEEMLDQHAKILQENKFDELKLDALQQNLDHFEKSINKI